MMNRKQGNLNMTFASFVQLYIEDVRPRLKENTWHTKEHIIRTKLLPYFGQRRISEISSHDVIRWQNEMINHRDNRGKPFSPVYLKTLHNSFSSIMNHAVRHYGLRENPAAKVGNMGQAVSGMGCALAEDCLREKWMHRTRCTEGKLSCVCGSDDINIFKTWS